jgi:hypothetical protein
VSERRPDSAVAGSGFVEVAGAERVAAEKVEEVVLGFGTNWLHHVKGE